MYISDEARKSVFKSLWEAERISYVAILYCDGNGNIACAPIKVENATLYIEQRQWPALDRVPFKTLEDLLTALEQNGFKQIPGTMDTVEKSAVSYPKRPTNIREQLDEPGVFMLDRQYSFRIQFEPSEDRSVAFSVGTEEDTVLIDTRYVPELNKARFDNLDSLLKALNDFGQNARVIDWSVINSGVRWPIAK
jgi:hypothetical protein